LGTLVEHEPRKQTTHDDVRTSDRRNAIRGGRRQADKDAYRAACAEIDGAAAVVLVVDDFPDGREMVAEYLRFQGFQVDEARSGEEALAKAGLNPPDIVLLDLALPDIDGLDVARRLKLESTKPIEIIVLTAAVFGDVRERVSAAGIATFIPKPCDLQQVVLQVHAVARRMADGAGG
jgi:two-component system, OmpR family, response regulator